MRSLLPGSDTAHVVDAKQLPPAPDGRQYRYEVVVQLDDAVDSAPSDDDVREIADAVLEAIAEIDDPDWPGADELYIQIYGPDRELDAGACGTAHWVAGDYESIETRSYFFGGVGA
ncbi:hypothetical protein JMJ58_14895 [Haloterrigena salifodinae]|uniref:Uncharacterized protein n=1 Tax=Haloterrigena salifodinae TaxID=2675099 RepID=A0A8T8DYA7_9EURY|nr:hypothetical protein [Haloterrigena salifodinae]QRV14221.1 hypothetical protein JMJ58_14895 [Haloterrigena salifodinae]